MNQALDKRKRKQVVVGSARLSQSTKMPVVTAAMKEQMRAAAKKSNRKIFPELPEWKLDSR